MSSTQKIIKNLAIAFAFFLIFNIISGIIYGLSIFTNIFKNNENLKPLEEIEELTSSDATLLSVDLKATSLIIKTGDIFKAETSNKYIETKQDKEKIYITERNHNWFKEEPVLIIYVPSNMVLDGVQINGGAGKIEIETLQTKILDLNLGAGKVDINNLQVLSKAIVEGGAGSVSIKNSILNNLNLNMGIGKFSLDAKVLGNSTIEQGVGSIDLNLIGTNSDYQIYVNKGLGSINIDGKNVKDDETVGNGMNKIDIDGGVGSINIDFKNLRG